MTESRRTVFIQTESTPNPEFLKFVPSVKKTFWKMMMKLSP
jgi:hypothetical protein